jgi:hypothetical protein
VARYEAQYAIYQSLYPATRELMHRLAELDRNENQRAQEKLQV